MSGPASTPTLTFQGVFETLYAAFGPQDWWPADTPFEVAVGAILTQNTAWTNVERAIAALKAADRLAAGAIEATPDSELADLIRPAGYFNVKARRLKALCHFLIQGYGGEVERMAAIPPDRSRDELLGIKGVGEETADSILLYALGQPVFVVDAYTRRIFERLDLLSTGLSYGRIQAAFDETLPREAGLFNEYHALIVALGKDLCKPRPRCAKCPLAPSCPHCKRVSVQAQGSP